jgi:hypothetical protein
LKEKVGQSTALRRVQSRLQASPAGIGVRAEHRTPPTGGGGLAAEASGGGLGGGGLGGGFAVVVAVVVVKPSGPTHTPASVQHRS